MDHYVVRQRLTEVYDIIVDADSEDEAVETANSIDLKDWVNVSTTTPPTAVSDAFSSASSNS